jgi:hypothetical protein
MMMMMLKTRWIGTHDVEEILSSVSVDYRKLSSEQGLSR